MNQPSQTWESEDGQSTIIKWDAWSFWSRTANGAFFRVGLCEDGLLRCYSGGSDRSDDAYRHMAKVPPEFARWLSGERTPPPQPIKPGDRVQTMTGSAVALVLAVDGDYAWAKSDSVGYGTYRLAALRRVGEAQ